MHAYRIALLLLLLLCSLSGGSGGALARREIRQHQPAKQ
jgi:hypothetical protein